LKDHFALQTVRTRDPAYEQKVVWAGCCHAR
jgi:hypothetical protein